MKVVRAHKPTRACKTPPALMAVAVALWWVMIHHGGVHHTKALSKASSPDPKLLPRAAAAACLAADVGRTYVYEEATGAAGGADAGSSATSWPGQ